MLPISPPRNPSSRSTRSSVVKPICISYSLCYLLFPRRPLTWFGSDLLIYQWHIIRYIYKLWTGNDIDLLLASFGVYLSQGPGLALYPPGQPRSLGHESAEFASSNERAYWLRTWSSLAIMRCISASESTWLLLIWAARLRATKIARLSGSFVPCPLPSFLIKPSM